MEKEKPASEEMQEIEKRIEEIERKLNLLWKQFLEGEEELPLSY